MKTCRICKEEKELTEYYKHPGNKDKRFTTCKKCSSELSSKRYYKLKEDPEKFAIEREKKNAYRRERLKKLKALYKKK